MTETANSPGDDEPLFGPPNLAGNQFDFDANSMFRATADGAGGGILDITDGQLNLGVMGDNSAIVQLVLSVAGDYSLTGVGGNATSADYQIGFTEINVLEVDGVALTAPLVLPGLDATGLFDLSSGPATNEPWSSTLTYDVNAALAASTSFQFGATKIEVQMNNVFNAGAQTGDFAEIAAGSVVFDAFTTPVPEPSSGAVLVLTALGCLGVRRRGQS